jgi:hypothetical protein
MSAFHQWLLQYASLNPCCSNHNQPRRLVTFQMKKSHLARLNVSPASVEQMELGAQPQLCRAVVQRGIIGELQKEITGEVIVQKYHVVVVIAERKEVTARIGVQFDTRALSDIGVETEVQFAIEIGAGKEAPCALGVVQYAETEVHAIETENIGRNPGTTRTGR